MKDLVSIFMILSVMLGFIGVGRLCWDTKYAILLLFAYAIGALLIIGMVGVMNSGDTGTKPAREKLQLRPNEREWIVRGKNMGDLKYLKYLENIPSFSKFI